jgi:rhomboid protease GluP
LFRSAQQKERHLDGPTTTGCFQGNPLLVPVFLVAGDSRCYMFLAPARTSDHSQRMPLPRKPLRASVLQTLATPRPLIVLIATCLTTEIVLSCADHQLIGTPLWRPLAYQNGGFWAGLLGDWQANYALQPYLMFLTYGFLHAGPAHAVGNMLALWPLGLLLISQTGLRRFVIVYLAALLGGGAAFGLLSTSPAPMVGASGAVFGLAAAMIVVDWHGHYRLWRSLAGAAGLAFINLVTWVALQGQLAWETHLGGALAGAAAVMVSWPRPALKK